MTADEAAAGPRPSGAASRRELAVARSLGSARVQAEKRVQRFLDAALELMITASGKEFTVQEVVERSGQSLRSFYQLFAGKHELQLALFEESVRSTAEHLREVVADEDDALARLHRFVVDYYEVCRPTPKDKSTRTASMRAMGEFAQQLLTQHPKEAAQAFVPLVLLFDELLDQAAAAGLVRSDIGRHRITGVVLPAIMFNTFAATVSGTPIRSDAADAEELWQLVLRGIGNR